MVPPSNETSDHPFSAILDKDPVPSKKTQINYSLYVLVLLFFGYLRIFISHFQGANTHTKLTEKFCISGVEVAER